MSKIAVLGSGQVGQVLADGFLKHGHEVMRGTREPAKLDEWLKGGAGKKGAGDKASTGTFAEAATFGEIVVLAVKGTAAESAVDLAGAGLEGKVVLDATNPIADTPPVNGVLVYFTAANESLMERLQKKVPSAKFVKAFSSVGNAFMVNPDFGGTRPTMFICGNDADAKTTATKLLDQFGWDAEDMGPVEAARPIESLCILWCLPGFVRNQWNHVFKLLKK